MAIRTVKFRVCASAERESATTLPGKPRPGKACVVISTFAPGKTRAKSASDRLARPQIFASLPTGLLNRGPCGPPNPPASERPMFARFASAWAAAARAWSRSARAASRSWRDAIPSAESRESRSRVGCARCRLASALSASDRAVCSSGVQGFSASVPVSVRTRPTSSSPAVPVSIPPARIASGDSLTAAGGGAGVAEVCDLSEARQSQIAASATAQIRIRRRLTEASLSRPLIIPPAWIVISALFSEAIGAFFECYPARKAAARSHRHPPLRSRAARVGSEFEGLAKLDRHAGPGPLKANADLPVIDRLGKAGSPIRSPASETLDNARGGFHPGQRTGPGGRRGRLERLKPQISTSPLGEFRAVYGMRKRASQPCKVRRT